MGLFDNLAGGPSLSPEEKQAAKDAKAADKVARKEAKAALKARIQYKQGVKFIAGQQLVNAPQTFFGNEMMQLDDDTVIFNLDEPKYFRLRGVEFAGAKYHEETTKQDSSDTQSTGKTKKKRHGLGGAIIGTAFGPLGTAAGAIVGSHVGKDKTTGTSSTTATSTSTTNQVEDPSSTEITLESVDDASTITVVLETMTNDYYKLKSFKVAPEESAPQATEPPAAPAAEAPADQPAPAAEPAVDPIAELRKYKALLDDEIISQEDFDAKKKQLLGL
ncbi:SHOCT domain-containing protein [Lacticaseibacillus absianus]|uniref:SHOCT domain-containing protein n=1 Tax=Lacticaseibacillus absianus TaxID=2729623 RepID=UPI001FE531C0|nr:SHOCT domain-containing protein [Lacticaseibacillus absianus]